MKKYFQGFSLLLIVLFFSDLSFAQKVRKTGIGIAEVAGNISEIEAQKIAQRKARENAISQLGSFFISETILLSFSSQGISELTVRSFMDEIRATHLSLVGQEKMQRYVEEDKVKYKALATYEFDENRFEKQVQQYLKTLQRSELNDELKNIEKLAQKLKQPNLSIAEYTKVKTEIQNLKGKVNNLYINRQIIGKLDDDVTKKLERLDLYLEILDNYLGRGFIEPYLSGISIEPFDIKNKQHYKIQITISYEVLVNEELLAHYFRLPKVLEAIVPDYYQKNIASMDKKYPYYTLRSVYKNQGNFRKPLYVLNEPIMAFSKTPRLRFDIINDRGKKITSIYENIKVNEKGKVTVTISRKALGKSDNYEVIMSKYWKD